MARRKRKVNKTQAIRDFLAANPGLPPREVAGALGQQGISVTAQYVSAIKSKTTGVEAASVEAASVEAASDVAATGEAPAPQRRRGRPRLSASDTGVSVGYKSLLEARSFVRSIGDIDEARKVLDAYANLQ